MQWVLGEQEVLSLHIWIEVPQMSLDVNVVIDTIKDTTFYLSPNKTNGIKSSLHRTSIKLCPYHLSQVMQPN